MSIISKFKTDEPIRWNALRLAQMVTSRATEIMNPSLIEYRTFAAVLSDEVIEVAIKMGVRKPKTFSEIQKLTKLPTEDLERILKEILTIGLGEFTYEGPNGERVYFIDIPVSGSSELMATNPELLANVPEVSEYFERCTREPVGPVAHMLGPGGSGVGMHVIPVEKAIDMENQSVELEHISYWLDKYDHFAFWPCQCRLMRQHNGMNVGDDPEGWCIGLGDFADFLVETNRGTYATREEVEETLRRADEQGFVHQVTNIDGQDKVFILCNCNVNNCLALRTSQLFNTPNLSRSSYVAHVDPNNCVACGKCVEKCPAGAVKLGQKLCTKNGPIEYPKHILPDDHIWGKKYWDENYRDTNRINTYETGTAPCKTACPAHIGIQGYLKLAREGKYEEALELIKMDNPFPAICGRVCNKRCEAACTRGLVDDPVAIDDVKNFLAQRDLDAETRYIPAKRAPKVHGEFDEKIAIIGAGPAGLSCAYYLAILGYTPTVFDKNPLPGGMMTYGIPSFKLEKDVINAEIDVLRELGVEFQCGVNVGEDVTIPELREQGYKAFYVAIGCQGSRKANIAGEDAEGVMSAVDYLHEVYADEANAPKTEGRTIVVGGGNVAIDVARTAHRLGSASVRLFSLESREEMPALPIEIQEAEEEDVVIENGWGPKEILTKDGKVCGVVFKKCTSVKDASGKFNPQYDEDDTIMLECENLFLSIGQRTDWGKLLDGTKAVVENGRIVVDKETWQTGDPDVFVGGDVYTGPKFVIDAIGAGHMASEVLHRYVRVGDLNAGRDRREFTQLDKDNIVLAIDQYDRPERQTPGFDESIDRLTSFRDARVVLTEEQVQKETSRCLSCGASVVDENQCLGCGVCTNQCKFDAIHLSRDNPECTDMRKYEDLIKNVTPYVAKRAVKIVKRAVSDKLSGN